MLEKKRGYSTRLDKLRRLALESRVKLAQRRALDILENYGKGLTCDCCGYTPLQRATLINGRLLGPECTKTGHVYPCRGLTVTQ
jgi:hypothetical protein